MDAYRAVVDKRDQRAFLPKPILEASLRRAGVQTSRDGRAWSEPVAELVRPLANHCGQARKGDLDTIRQLYKMLSAYF